MIMYSSVQLVEAFGNQISDNFLMISYSFMYNF